MVRKECPSCLGLGLIPFVGNPMPCPDCDMKGYVEVEEDGDVEESDKDSE